MTYDITCEKTDQIVTISQGEGVIEFDSRQRVAVLDVLENGDSNLPNSSAPSGCGNIRVQVSGNEVRVQQDIGEGTDTILTLVDKLTACLRPQQVER